jgi:hypothetical protein
MTTTEKPIQFPRIKNPIVGKFYHVACVRSKASNRPWLPILGPLHEDAQYTGFKPLHYHYDFRFIADYIFAGMCWPTPSRVFGVVATSANVDITKIEVRRRKCHRQMPEYPHEHAVWLPQLEAAYADKKLKCMTCPHRGLPLDGLPVKDGVVTCPGHGLRWHVETGCLVPAIKLAEAEVGNG